MSAYNTLELELTAPVARLTLARPEKLNALSPETLAELVSASAQITANSEVKVVIVAGQGRAFCAGYDLGAVDGVPDAARVDLGRQMAGHQLLIRR